MEAEPVRYRSEYRLEITLHEMQHILLKDSRCWSSDKKLTLCSRLSAFNLINNVEYSGHYGPAVFYSVLIEDDVLSTHAMVRTIIRRYLSGMQKPKASTT